MFVELSSVEIEMSVSRFKFPRKYIDSEEKEYCRMIDEYSREFEKKEQMCSLDRDIRTA